MRTAIDRPLCGRLTGVRPFAAAAGSIQLARGSRIASGAAACARFRRQGESGGCSALVLRVPFSANSWANNSAKAFRAASASEPVASIDSCGPLHGRQRQDVQDALSVDAFAVFHDLDLRLKLIAALTNMSAGRACNPCGLITRPQCVAAFSSLMSGRNTLLFSDRFRS